jgi:hypothetical protein
MKKKTEVLILLFTVLDAVSQEKRENKSFKNRFYYRRAEIN